MSTITINLPDNNVRKINTGSDASLLKCLQDAGIYLPAICGGKGTCGKCKLKLLSGSLPVTLADDAYFSEEELDAGWRLSCMAFPAGDIAVQILESGENQFTAVDSFEQQEADQGVLSELFTPQKDALSFARQLEPDRLLSLPELLEVSKLNDPSRDNNFSIYRKHGKIIRIGDASEALYAVAIDIGTTTLGFALLDLHSGKIISRYSAVNKQRESGGDVISRIQKANDGGLLLLSGSVRKQIAEGINELCASAAVEAGNICKIAIAGNTTMLHLLLGLSCQTLGNVPFTPVTLDMVLVNWREIIGSDLSSPLDSGCEIAILPGISTYVGADITSGLYSTELHKHEGAAAFIDIGTNGEMALVHNGKIICTATAAGPAFEGGNILCGTGSVPGAISKVKFQDGVFVVNTIKDQPPVGICGSGVVDMVYQGLKHGYIKPSGRFTEKVQDNTIILAKDIVFCQKDVRELQLGKSAIRSGLDALLNHTGLNYDEITTLYIAGGFGFNLDMESAVGIGLIPPALLPKVSLIGNSALGGAVRYLLSTDGNAVLSQIIKQSEEFSLPTDKYFTQHFLSNVNFE